ncbi:acyl-CoA dehydrogenase family protein [Nocardioides sp. AE5]|uniref:acyl-CoA dehydrogenase family protein n=1 Tax=Nocardioides sp. AE5 TaxID=2962573 RepID=UPI002881663B|nr:acyl-CoA dehydrogenase family protein [Nocardioides sp. AE5]MDT0203131.1 acyl-CoA dehydrogenase family protein [Nocardioides sp. AE5]
MDFSLDEDLVSLADLARTIFDDLATTDRVREVETSQTRIDAPLWGALGEAGLIGLPVPEEHDGAGLGLDALCVVLEEQGRHVAPVPLWSAGVAALVLARFGTGQQRADLLPDLASGASRTTLALEEYDGAEPSAPLATARKEGDGWRVTGTKAVVPSLTGADHVLVSATAEAGPGLFLVALDGAGAGDGVSSTLSETTSWDLAGELVLDDAPATAVGTPGDRALAVTLRTAAIALAALQVGVADGAMRLAASYLSEREQFGRPLGTFQAVQHQLADCFIDIDAMRVTLWQALVADADDPLGAEPGGVAERAALVAKWWCDKGGLDVVHRTQHVHGGIGVDTDYPVHRHFLLGKQVSATLGGEHAALASLGDLIATTEVAS